LEVPQHTRAEACLAQEKVRLQTRVGEFTRGLKKATNSWNDGARLHLVTQPDEALLPWMPALKVECKLAPHPWASEPSVYR